MEITVEQKKTRTKKKSDAIQALRAVSIIGVVAYHNFHSLSPHGWIGVDIFFVISGYLMTMILCRSGITKSSTINFFQRRIKRIVPLYLLTILGTLLFGRIFYRQHHVFEIGKEAFWPLFFIYNFYYYFFDESKEAFFDVAATARPFKQTWSLCVELQYYTLVPLIFFVFLKFERKIRICCTLFAIVGSFCLHMFTPFSFNFRSLPTRFWEFMIGTLTYEIIQIFEEQKISPTDGNSDLKQIKVVQISNFSYFSLLTILSYAGCWFLLYFSTGNLMLDRALSCLLAALVIGFSKFEKSSFLSFTPLRYIGNISYSLYLVHFPVSRIAMYSMQEYWQSQVTVKQVLISIFLSILISCLLYHSVEKWWIKAHFKTSVISIVVLYVLTILLITEPYVTKKLICGDYSIENSDACPAFNQFTQIRPKWYNETEILRRNF
ncbi:unnamed protein product, partial [Mesorhabditis belari]|uniref:Acyltransferase 3 domain-containing protein n=1 Tax=Mesorhabditis belari TaxID=2138241 RepID=A0AAF3EBZ2_9BILA